MCSSDLPAHETARLVDNLVEASIMDHIYDGIHSIRGDIGELVFPGDGWWVEVACN